MLILLVGGLHGLHRLWKGCDNVFCTSPGKKHPDCCAPPEFNEKATCSHGRVALRLHGECFGFQGGSYTCCQQVNPAATVGLSTQGMLSPRGMSLEELRSIFLHAGLPRTVAVVGSSGNLLFGNYGAEIDSHGLVMRFNEAITAGYEADVGRSADSGRTDGVIRTAWEEGFNRARDAHVLHSGEIIIQNVRNLEDDADYWVDEHPTVHLAASWVKMLHEDLLDGTGDLPSTGFVGLAVAVAMAQEVGGNVSVYGFGACQGCGKYFDCVRGACRLSCLHCST